MSRRLIKLVITKNVQDPLIPTTDNFSRTSPQTSSWRTPMSNYWNTSSKTFIISQVFGSILQFQMVNSKWWIIQSHSWHRRRPTWPNSVASMYWWKITKQNIQLTTLFILNIYMYDLNLNISQWLLTLKVDNPCSGLLFLLIHPYLSNMWLGVCLQEQIPKCAC